MANATTATPDVAPENRYALRYYLDRQTSERLRRHIHAVIAGLRARRTVSGALLLDHELRSQAR